MGFAKTTLKIAAVAAVVEGARRLAAKPEVQQKTKELLGKASQTAGNAAGKAADKTGETVNAARKKVLA